MIRHLLSRLFSVDLPGSSVTVPHPVSDASAPALPTAALWGGGLPLSRILEAERMVLSDVETAGGSSRGAPPLLGAVKAVPSGDPGR